MAEAGKKRTGRALGGSAKRLKRAGGEFVADEASASESDGEAEIVESETEADREFVDDSYPSSLTDDEATKATAEKAHKEWFMVPFLVLITLTYPFYTHSPCPAPALLCPLALSFPRGAHPTQAFSDSLPPTEHGRASWSCADLQKHCSTCVSTLPSCRVPSPLPSFLPVVLPPPDLCEYPSFLSCLLSFCASFPPSFSLRLKNVGIPTDGTLPSWWRWWRMRLAMMWSTFLRAVRAVFPSTSTRVGRRQRFSPLISSGALCCTPST